MTRTAAVLALDVLERRFGSSRARIAPLGGGDAEPRPSVILAGRFTDDVIEAVRQAVAELGGTVVVDVDETITGSR